MASWQAKTLKTTLQVSRLARSNQIGALRKWFALSARGRIPADVRHQPVDAGGVPAEWVRIVPPPAPRRDPVDVVLYAHGGGFSVGSCATHREFVGRLAREIGCDILSVDYRLAPEHPFPAAPDDFHAAWLWLLDQGVNPERALIAGDSAGATLTLSLLLRLRDAGSPLPAAAVCFSPCVDLSAGGVAFRTNASDEVMLDEELVELFAEWYVAGADRTDPLVSPIFGDLTGLPPMLVMAGTDEMLLADARRWEERAREADVDVTLEIWDDMVHIWPYFAWFLPEGRAAVRRVGEYVRRVTASTKTARAARAR